MIQLFKTDEDYKKWLDGQILPSGIVVYVSDDETMYFRTNNIKGELKTYKCEKEEPIQYPPLIYSAKSAGSTITVNGETVTLGQGDNMVLEYPTAITSVKATKNTALTAIQIPNTVTEIEGNTSNMISKPNSAFYKCTSLVSVILPDTIKSIGTQAFKGCASLLSINIPNSVTSIGSSAFTGCTSLVSVTLPESVKSIGQSAFYSCTSLASVTLPEGIKSLNNNIFYNCSSLASVTLPESLTSIGESTFGNCASLVSITIPNSVTSIGIYAFGGTALTSITIPNSVTSFGERVFASCAYLKNVTLPDTVTSIGYRTFYKCTALSDLNYIGTMSQWSSITLAENWNELAAIKVVHCTDGDVTL